jgi:hypothetical protein
MRLERFFTVGLLVAALLLGCGMPESTVTNQPVVTTHAPATAALPPPVAGSSASSVAAQATTGTQSTLPAEIIAFREKRDACDHFRGEEPYDAKRAAFLAAELARTCTGTDRELAALRKRFAGNAKAIAALKDYEDKIE